MFKEDEGTGLPVKLTRQEKTTSQEHQNKPPKRKTTMTGKRTSGRPTHKLQTTGVMSLQTDDKVEKSTNNNTREKPASSGSDNDDQLSKSSEDIAPSPKSQTKILRHPQSQQYHNGNQHGTALSTASGNLVPINAINDKDDEGQKSFVSKLIRRHINQN